MWTETFMTVPESFIVSLMGLSIVMGTLICLALVVLAFSKVMESKNAVSDRAAVSRPAPEPPGISDEECSMILAVICEELHAAPEEINVTSIRELK